MKSCEKVTGGINVLPDILYQIDKEDECIQFVLKKKMIIAHYTLQWNNNKIREPEVKEIVHDSSFLSSVSSGILYF